MMQIKFLSDYADVFLDSEGVESDVFLYKQTNRQTFWGERNLHIHLTPRLLLYMSRQPASPLRGRTRGG